MSIAEVKPYEKNPRKNDQSVDKVANSIKEFGFKVPIVVDKNNIIVCGHTRYKAAKKLGLSVVPCVVADDLTEEQIKAYRLADNKVGEDSLWDMDLLSEELGDILDLDMSDFGFELLEDEPEEVIEDEFDAELPEEPKAKLGDIYQLGNHRLMCGDSTSVDDIDKLLNGNKVVLYLSDPPYGVDIVQAEKVGGAKPFGKVGFGEKGNNKILDCNTYMPIKGDDTTETAQMNYNIISQITDNQIIFGGNYFTDFLEPKACWIVWDKENTGNFADVELAWTSFDKGAKLYRWLWNGLCRKGERSVEGRSRVHPTQKPVGLMGEILKDFSKVGDTILDCFGGSGSTLIACEQLQRNCYMMEYEPHYIDVIIARWEQFTGQKAVLLNEET